MRRFFVAHANRARRLGQVGLGAEVLAAVTVTAAMLVRFAAYPTPQCESGASPLEAVVVLSTLLALVAGGVVVAALSADARRRGGMLWWHLVAGAVTVVVPLVVFVEAIIFGLICSGR